MLFGARYVIGDRANAIHITNRSTAKFLNDQCHVSKLIEEAATSIHILQSSDRRNYSQIDKSNGANCD